MLVNNAGVGSFKTLVDTDLDTFNAVFATNVTGAMLMAREAAKHFVSRNRGNIVNISSTASLRVRPGGRPTREQVRPARDDRMLAGRLRQYNVRVFLVNPSEVITDFATGAGLDQKDDPTKLHAEDIAGMVKAMLEMDDRGFTPELSVFATNPKD